MQSIKYLTQVVLVLFILSCSSPNDTRNLDTNEYATKISDWIDLNIGLITYERISPPKASRVLAYSSVALYQGLYNGLDGYESLSNQLNELDLSEEFDASKNYNWYVVGITSQKEMLNYLYKDTSPASLQQIEELYTLQLQSEENISRSSIIERSVEYGETLGKELVLWAQTDGYAETRNKEYLFEPQYSQWIPTANISSASLSLNPVLNIVTKYDSTGKNSVSKDAGLYSDRMLTTNRPQQITNERVAMEPFWGELRTFALDSLSSFDPVKPFEYSENKSSDFYKEALVVYNSTKDLTDWEKETAHFWADNPGQTGTPPGHWFSIMSQLIDQKELKLSKALEMYVLTNISMADAFISCWREKYESMVIRPETYIQRVIDENWRNIIVTPPFPEYTSGHSVCSGAAAEVLTFVLGDNVSFTDRTHEHQYGFKARTYSSFYEAADEAAISRLYGGIHYPMAIYNGLDQGKAIGQNIATNLTLKTK